jgi:pyrimidine oxygenase
MPHSSIGRSDAVDIGVFIPIGSNGWLISTTSPRYRPSFALNRAIVQKAEHYGLDFALSMIKLRGFGGESEFWDHNLESFTLMAGLAAVTSRIRLLASVAVLTLPPAIVARMASTIDSISNGRFGVNLVTGWQKAEYEQMGLWPGEVHFARRYDFLAEYVQVMRELWTSGHSDFKGDYFTMNDCRLSPQPGTHIPLVCAGQSDTGMAFAAKYCDFNFCSAEGINTPTKAAGTVARLRAATAGTGREVGAYLLVMIIADESDAAAFAKWEHYKAGTDLVALNWAATQAGADTKAQAHSTAGRMAKVNAADQEGPVPTRIGRLIGSYASVARMLDEIAGIEGVAGVLLTFDDFLIGMEQFGHRIQPLMASRGGIKVAA